jgi:hypothetical protein
LKILVLAGAGTSVELGVPGMVGMAEEFLSHARQWDIEPDLAAQIMGAVCDVENLIEGLDQISQAKTPLTAMGQEIDFARVDKLRSEVEWFVQHLAERLIPSDAHLMWGPLLRTVDPTHLTLVTTNYDRAIELAANAERLSLADGYTRFGKTEIAPWVGFAQDDRRTPLVKMHGSTDWYASDKHGVPYKLRHPMPLFGRSILSLSGGHQLGSALVLPSREKLLTRAPYPRLSQQFLNAADACDWASFVGSSMRDPHIREAAASIVRRVPLFIVNPAGETYGLEGACGIAQPASTFLMSTLPAALLTDDPIAYLRSTEADTSETSTLTAARQALNERAPTAVRCRALDELYGKKATLDSTHINELLRASDPTVARYALGLIPYSPVRESLIEEAERSLHYEDAAFGQDLVLLRSLD